MRLREESGEKSMMYKVLSVEDEPSAGEAVTALEVLVNEKLQEGWTPQGGVSVTYDSFMENYSASQAIVKERKK